METLLFIVLIASAIGAVLSVVVLYKLLTNGLK
jgi:hypothetical protein